MRRFDVATMFGSLWLLASMIIDIATPKELNVYMAGAAIAPATLITALLYWLRVPRLDFAVSFTTLWLVSGMVIELISPTPLSPFFSRRGVRTNGDRRHSDPFPKLATFEAEGP